MATRNPDIMCILIRMLSSSQFRKCILCCTKLTNFTISYCTRLTMHPHIIGHRSRMMILEELIQHIRAQTGIWFATHADVVRYVKSSSKG